eukprot:g3323.t1
MEIKEPGDTDVEICPYTLQTKNVISHEAFSKHGRKSRVYLAMDLSEQQANEKKKSSSRPASTTEQKRSTRSRTLSRDDISNVIRRQRSAFGQIVSRRRKSMSSKTSMLKPKSPGVSFYTRKHLSVKNKVKALSVTTKLYMCRIFANIKTRVFKRLYITLIKWKLSVGLGFHPDPLYESPRKLTMKRNKGRRNSNSTSKRRNSGRWQIKKTPLLINRPYVEQKLRLCSQSLHYEKNRQCVIKIWYKWKALRCERKASRILVVIASNTYNRRCKTKYIKLWIKYVKIRVITKTLMGTNTKKRNEHITSKYFVAWSRKSIQFKFERENLKRHEGICKKFLNTWLRKTTTNCFHSWKTFYKSKSKARLTMLKALNRMDNGLLSMGMDTWKENSKEIAKESAFINEINYLKQQIAAQENEKKKILCNR